MASPAYYDWLRDGKPFKLSVPIVEYRQAFRAAGWPVLYLGALGNQAHLTAEPPKDHCPFSATGWPLPHPYPYVTGFDVSHGGGPLEPVLDSIVEQWVSDARAGKTRWVKYIIYKGRSWSVVSNWEEHEAEGHFDHAHKSMRTDWVTRSTIPYDPMGGKTMPDESLAHWIDEMRWRIYDTLVMMNESSTSDPSNPVQGGQQLRMPRILKDIDQRTTISAQTLLRIEAQMSSGPAFDYDRFAAALVAQPGFIDAMASTVAARLGMIPTAGQIARAIGELRFQARPETPL